VSEPLTRQTQGRQVNLSLTLPSVPLIASSVRSVSLGHPTRSGDLSRTYTDNPLFLSLDPVQVTQMAKYLETVYVSGWQSSSTASSTNEPGPDLAGETISQDRSFPPRSSSMLTGFSLLADYPSNTVPNKVTHLFQAQLFHDR
jgi:hypothetical protein